MPTTPSYTEVATADGTWVCRLHLPPAPFEQVRDVLAEFARATGWPVAAFAYGDTGELVDEILLYRDPSRTYGTPPAEECDAAARALVAATGWRTAPEQAPTSGVLVGLGLREGYDAEAPQHEPAEVAAKLAAQGSDHQYRTAQLVSARRINDSVRWYDEIGVIIHAPDHLLPTITNLAHAFAQHRFVVTDLAENRTYALAQ